MKLSKNELSFVTRFNEETFFKNVPMKPIIDLGLEEKRACGFCGAVRHCLLRTFFP